MSLHWWSLKHTQSFSAWIHIFLPGKGKINAFKILTSLKWNYIIFHFFSSLQSLPGTHLLTSSVYLILKLTAPFSLIIIGEYIHMCVYVYTNLCSLMILFLHRELITARIGRISLSQGWWSTLKAYSSNKNWLRKLHFWCGIPLCIL